MITEIYLVKQEKRCGFFDKSDYSFINYERAFNKKKDAELYLYQLKQDLFNEGYKPYNDLDEAFYGDSRITTATFCKRDKLVKLTIKQIFLM